jgi:hypothetical protein
LQANAAEAHVSLLEAQLRNGGAQAPALQLTAQPAPPPAHTYGLTPAPVAASNQPASPLTPAFATQPAAQASHMAAHAAAKSVKPAYQQLLAALQSERDAVQRAPSPHGGACNQRVSLNTSPCTHHTGQQRHDWMRTQHGGVDSAPPAQWRERMPLHSVQNMQQYERAPSPDREPSLGHATRHRSAAGQLQTDAGLQPWQNKRGHDGMHAPTSNWHAAGGSALERMQRLHERLKASELDVQQKLGRMLNRPTGHSF